MVVAAEVCNAANDFTQFQPLVAATENNLAESGSDPVGAFVADAGYWSVPNVTLEVDAEILIAPMPATQGITDRNDPRIAQRQAVIARLDTGQLTVRQAAEQMGVSETWARKLLRDHRSGFADPAQLREEMKKRLGTEAGAAAYAKRKTTVEPVFGNLKANLRFQRVSRRDLEAVRSEWRLICSVHNLLKLHRHRLATT